MKKVVVIGSGKVLVDCTRHLAAQAGVQVALALHYRHAAPQPERLDTVCAEHGIEVLPVRNPNRREVLRRVAAVRPDLIFSINNHRILKPPLLELARDGAINFHNGPLPAYRGVNIPTWAIVNGETEHGVTWHFVDEGIDTGDVALDTRFSIEPGETALRLVFRCILAATKIFPELVERWLSNDLPRRPQTGTGGYYGLRDVPNDGWIDFAWDFERLDRFVRGLDYRPFPNPVSYPHASLDGRPFIVNRLTRSDGAPSRAPGGTVLECDGERLVVAVGDGAAVLEEVMDGDDRQVSVAELVSGLGIRVGDRLSGRPG